MDDNNRLIDEALSSDPIKNTFRLGWEFIILNKKFTYLSLAIAIGANILTSLDERLGFVPMLIYTFYMLTIQVEIGRIMHGTQNIETFVSDVKALDIITVVRKNIERVIGSFIGWTVIYTGLMVTFLIVGVMIYGLIGSAKEAFALAIIPMLLLLLFVAYLQPLIQAKIALSTNLEEAMFAVFSIVKKEFRIRAFKKSYFKYAASMLFVLLAIPFAISSMYAMGLFSSVPLLNEILIVLLPIAGYIATVIMAVGYMMANRMVEEV